MEKGGYTKGLGCALLGVGTVQARRGRGAGEVRTTEAGGPLCSCVSFCREAVAAETLISEEAGSNYTLGT